MSDRRRTPAQITKDLLDKEFVDVEEKNRALATCLYNTRNSHPFMGSVLQSMNIMYTHQIPTAGIMFNTDAKRWDMWINPKYFCHRLNSTKTANGKTGQAVGDLARQAVMLHELSHITNKHPIRVPFLKISPRKRMIMNVAMDMAINQYIKNLPTGCPECPPHASGEPCKNDMCPGKCIDVNDWFDEVKKADGSIKKTPWESNQTAEHYYEKIIERLNDEGEDDDENGDGAGKGIPETLDEHMWEGNVEEKEMLEATEDLMKRAMIKSRFDYSDLPDSVKDLLDHIKTRRAELDYKGMILAAIKKSASGHERKGTWTRPSRRYGNKAPGTTVGDLPKLNMYLDTSGSISTEELNEFLEIVDNFLKAGSRKCRLNLFHTDNYYSGEYKLGTRLGGDNGVSSKVESGGTCLEASMRDIAKRRPDLAIFITDGYYSNVDAETWLPPNQKFPQCLFIISRQGTKDHPLKRFGHTIQIPSDGAGSR
jgi:predicted metal-dependent peptidase